MKEDMKRHVDTWTVEEVVETVHGIPIIEMAGSTYVYNGRWFEKVEYPDIRLLLIKVIREYYTASCAYDVPEQIKFEAIEFLRKKGHMSDLSDLPRDIVELGGEDCIRFGPVRPAEGEETGRYILTDAYLREMGDLGVF